MGHEADRTVHVCRFSTLYEIMTKHFQHFKTTQGYFSVWKKVFFIQEWIAFFPIIGDKSPKSDMELTDLATDECLSNFVRSCSVSRAKGNVST